MTMQSPLLADGFMPCIFSIVPPVINHNERFMEPPASSEVGLVAWSAFHTQGNEGQPSNFMLLFFKVQYNLQYLVVTSNYLYSSLDDTHAGCDSCASFLPPFIFYLYTVNRGVSSATGNSSSWWRIAEPLGCVALTLRKSSPDLLSTVYIWRHKLSRVFASRRNENYMNHSGHLIPCFKSERKFCSHILAQRGGLQYLFSPISLKRDCSCGAGLY